MGGAYYPAHKDVELIEPVSLKLMLFSHVIQMLRGQDSPGNSRTETSHKPYSE